MAVIQISKIQVRRGQKLSGIGVPQLSSAEFAWAVDTQELFIGNGSIAEGAPEVGNTKVLTEHDNLLELISGYRFGSDNSVVLSVERSIQGKLDEYVSVLDFGAVPDGDTDCSEAFANAFRELFQSPGRQNLKKVLLIPNGEYIFSENLKIPSTAKLQGETQDGAILNIADKNILFITEDGKELQDFNSGNRPTNISISNLTIQHTTGQSDISGSTMVRIDKVKFISTYNSTDTIGALSSHPAAITWENTVDGTKVTDVIIKDCLFDHTGIGIRGNTISVVGQQSYDTFLKIDNCKFFVCDSAIVINNLPNFGNKWRIENCDFNEIANYSVYSSAGTGTLVKNCSFVNCGNLNNLPSSPSSYIISFGEKENNIVIDCSSDRHQSAAFADNETTLALSEVQNSSNVSFSDMNYSDIRKGEIVGLSVFGAYNRYTYIDYVLNLGVHSRVGQLIIVIDESRTNISLTDNFTYSSNLALSPGGIVMTGFQFEVKLLDLDLDSGSDTILLSYRNPNATGAAGDIAYRISYGV